MARTGRPIRRLACRASVSTWASCIRIDRVTILWASSAMARPITVRRQTARDRDKVRSEILRSLGWRLVRVWSTEWWVDRDGALERLHEAIGAELEDQRARAVEVKRAGKIDAAAAAIAIEAEGAAIVARDTERDHDAACGTDEGMGGLLWHCAKKCQRDGDQAKSEPSLNLTV